MGMGELIVGHLVGDYLFQNEWLAINKHKSAIWCLLHALIYTIVIMFFGNWYDWRLLAVFITHFVIDYWRLGIWWRQFFSRDTTLPWVILADNTIHLWILFILLHVSRG